jgi:hypothetical protein
MGRARIEFEAHKTVKKPTRVAFETKDGQEVRFKANGPVRFSSGLLGEMREGLPSRSCLLKARQRPPKTDSPAGRRKAEVGPSGCYCLEHIYRAAFSQSAYQKVV